MSKDVAEVNAAECGERSQGDIHKGIAEEPRRPDVPKASTYAPVTARKEQERYSAASIHQQQTNEAKSDETNEESALSHASGGVVEPVGRLPRRIEGGFRGVGEDLDLRAREWRNMVRILEHHRPQLEIAELERDRLYEAFARIGPEVEKSGRDLKETIAAMKDGDISGELSPKFARSLKSLDELESLASGLTSNLLAIRSAWEQYARSIIQAEKLRSRIGGAD